MKHYCSCFGSTYIKIGTIQRRLAWPLRKDDTQIREAFHIFKLILAVILFVKNLHNAKQCCIVVVNLSF